MIDTKLIAAHQWIVDETERKPGWWAEQAIMASITLDIVLRVATWSSGWDAVLLLLSLIIGAVLVHAARNEAFLKSLGESRGIRAFFLGLIAFQLFILFTEEKVVYNLMRVVSSIGMVSFYYFAACDAPRPKKRKEKLVPTVA